MEKLGIKELSPKEHAKLLKLARMKKEELQAPDVPSVTVDFCDVSEALSEYSIEV